MIFGINSWLPALQILYTGGPSGRIAGLPGSALADGKLAELTEQVGKMEEHPRSKSTQPNPTI